jgi:phage terminase large subunit
MNKTTAQPAIHIPVKPLRSYQRGLFQAWKQGIRKYIMVLPRRAGKDYTCLSFVAMRALQRVGYYFYMFPTLAHARKALWRNIDASGKPYIDAIPSSLIAAINQTEMSITLRNGSIIQCIGSDNIDRIVGVAGQGFVLSEAALHDPRSVDLIRPILTENPNCFLMLNGTPRGRHSWFYRTFEYAKTDKANWYAAYETADSIFRDAPGENGSPVLPREAIEQAIKEGMDPVRARTEFYCDWSSELSGAYYGDLMEQAETEGRITDVPWNPQLPCISSWDLGLRDSMCILFAQWDGQFLNIIDAVEDKTGKGLEYWIHEVKQVRRYNYSLHIAPHDIKVRELRDGKSRLEIARNLGIDFQVAPNLPIQDGISYVRGTLPRIRFDRTRCAGLVSALNNYCREWNEDREVFADKPLHNSASHYSDSLRYLCLAYDLADPGRWKEYPDAAGTHTSVWDNSEPSDGERRNAVGGFISQEREFSLEPVENINPATARVQRWYR